MEVFLNKQNYGLDCYVLNNIAEYYYKDKFDLVVKEIGSLKEKIIIFACNQLDMEGALDDLIGMKKRPKTGAENRTELREQHKNKVIKDITEQTFKQIQLEEFSIGMMTKNCFGYMVPNQYKLAGYKHHEFILFRKIYNHEDKDATYYDFYREHSKNKYNFRMKICNRDTYNPDDEYFPIHKMTFLK